MTSLDNEDLPKGLREGHQSGPTLCCGVQFPPRNMWLEQETRYLNIIKKEVKIDEIDVSRKSNQQCLLHLAMGVWIQSLKFMSSHTPEHLQCNYSLYSGRLCAVNFVDIFCPHTIILGGPHHYFPYFKDGKLRHQAQVCTAFGDTCLWNVYLQTVSKPRPKTISNSLLWTQHPVLYLV